MLYLIGLGLDYKDISLKAIEAIKKCDSVYLENYTSFSNFSVKDLETLVGKKIIPLSRKQVEEEMPFLKKGKSALLVFGDPLSATTHLEILKKDKTKIIHAPSVLTAIAETGLSLYKFGKTGSIPFWEDNFKPKSFAEVLKQNQKIKAHTLFLLDLRPEEKRFMTVSQAINMLLETKAITEKTFCIGCARLGTDEKIIKVGSAKELLNKDFGSGPHCVIVPSELNFIEEEVLNGFK